MPWGGQGLKAHVAQEVEHFLGKEEVTGSSPVVGSSAIKIYAGIAAGESFNSKEIYHRIGEMAWQRKNLSERNRM